MARSYKRDKMGRFAGGGGGGGGKKSGGSKQGSQAVSQRVATRYENKSRANELKAKGTTAIGGRVKAQGFIGQKAAEKRAGGLRATNVKGLKTKATGAGAGTRSGMKASAAQAGKTRSKAASKGTKKMSKAPVSAAKARFKELSGRARQSSPLRSAAENRKAAGAKRSLAAMIKKRGA
jgi:hypothetical protein